jgi:hypothetical protein
MRVLTCRRLGIELLFRICEEIAESFVHVALLDLAPLRFDHEDRDVSRLMDGR